MTESEQSNSRRVIVRLDVWIDPAVWSEIYGTTRSRRELAEDVRNYAISQLADSAAAGEGAILTVGWRS